MKRIVLSSCLSFLALFLVFPLAAKSPISSADVQDIIITHQQSLPGGGPRSGEMPVITAGLDDVLAVISITFQNARNNISVELENLDTQESVCFNNLCDGFYYLPFSGNPGYWVITIFLESGDEYIGYFTI